MWFWMSTACWVLIAWRYPRPGLVLHGHVAAHSDVLVMATSATTADCYCLLLPLQVARCRSARGRGWRRSAAARRTCWPL